MTATPRPAYAPPAALTQTVEIETPELVVLSYTIAGVGSRVAAALIDAAICVVLLLAATFAAVAISGSRVVSTPEPSLSVAIAVLILAQFAVLWGYYVFFEGLFDGQSPGKRLLKLRVVRDGGFSVGLGAAAVRNLLRIVDLQPGFTYFVGIGSILATRAGKRLGDIVAGTVVVRETFVQRRAPAAAPESSTDAAETTATAQLSDDEYSVLERWSSRYQSLDPARRAMLTDQLAARFAGLLPDPVTHPRLRDNAARLRWLASGERRARAAGAAGRQATGAARERHAIVAAGSARWAAFAAQLATAQRSGLKTLGEEGVRDFVSEYRALSADLARLRTASLARPDAAGDLFYLGRLVAGGHNLLYHRRGATAREALRFVAIDIPTEIRRSAIPILLAATMLFLPAAVAWIAVVRQPAVARVFIPDQMLDRANEGVQRAREESGYIPDPEVLRPVMAGTIIANNVQVTIAAFAFGITAGLGTTLLLLLNGVSLGGVMGLYQSKGILALIVAFVAPHGVLELSAICIAGGAGYLIAAALLVPGDRTRRRALAENSRRAITLFAGSTILLIVAGTLEGMVSPIPWWPLSLKLCVSALTALALVVYLRGGRSWEP